MKLYKYLFNGHGEYMFIVADNMTAALGHIEVHRKAEIMEIEITEVQNAIAVVNVATDCEWRERRLNE